MKGMPKPKSPFDEPSSSSAASLRPSEQVAVVGLKGQPQYNGRCAYVGAFDADAGRFECHLSPMTLQFGATGGLKMNWVDTTTEGALVIKVSA